MGPQQPPVAVPQQQGSGGPLLACRICGCQLTDRNDFAQHHRAPWHLYNLRRRSQQLPAVSEAEFSQKLELLRWARHYAEGSPLGGGPPFGGGPQGLLTAERGETNSSSSLVGDSPPALNSAVAAFHAAVRSNRKGTGHRKQQQQQQQQQQQGEETAEAAAAAGERSAAAKAAAAAWRSALQRHPERCNLFEEMPPFSSAAESLAYMKKAYGFFVPDEEYCVNPKGLLRRLWRAQQHQPSCLFCRRRFRGIRSALQHMQQQRHFQLRWDEDQQELLAEFFDYKKSYYDLLERLVPGKAEAPQLEEAPRETASSDDGGKAEVAEGLAETAEGEDDEEEWVDCSSSQEGDTSSIEERKQEELENMLKARGWRNARITEEGLLQLPSGHEVLSRAHAVFSRQRLRRQWGPRRAEKCVLLDLAGDPPSALHGYGATKPSLVLYRRNKMQRHLSIAGGGGTKALLVLRQQQRLLQPRQQARLAFQREAEEQRKLQQRRMRVGIKANNLQRVVLRETKCFL